MANLAWRRRGKRELDARLDGQLDIVLLDLWLALGGTSSVERKGARLVQHIAHEPWEFGDGQKERLRQRQRDRETERQRDRDRDRDRWPDGQPDKLLENSSSMGTRAGSTLVTPMSASRLDIAATLLLSSELICGL
jgi:hypothetical protein